MTPPGADFWGHPLPAFPAAAAEVPFVSGASPPRPACQRELAPGVLPTALDQGCLLLSTRNNTPITRARPPSQPISLLGNSTFPKDRSSNWLEDLSVKRASRKDAAGVLGTRSPEPRRSNLPINKMGAPQESTDWGGELKPSPTPEPHRSGEGRAQSRGIPPSASRPCCSCKHASLHVCFSFSNRGHYRLLFTKILQGSAVL